MNVYEIQSKSDFLDLSLVKYKEYLYKELFSRDKISMVFKFAAKIAAKLTPTKRLKET